MEVCAGPHGLNQSGVCEQDRTSVVNSLKTPPPFWPPPSRNCKGLNATERCCLSVVGVGDLTSNLYHDIKKIIIKKIVTHGGGLNVLLLLACRLTKKKMLSDAQF